MNNYDDYPDARPNTPETPPAPPGAEFPGEQLATQLLPWIESVRLIEGEAALLGTAYILGVHDHAWPVRVVERDGDKVAVDDPYDRLAEFHQLDADAGRMPIDQVPGYPGDYVLVIYTAGE